MTRHPPHSLLKDEQLETLRACLERRAVPNDGMSLEMLDGYLHAVVIGPETILPTEWFPRIFGHEPGHEYEWDKELTEVFGLVAQHQNSIAAALRVGEGDWAPLIDVYEVDGKRLSFGQEWALGFMRGVELRLAQWEPLGKDRALAPGWRAIGTLALGRNHPASGKRARTQAQRDRLIDRMLDFVEHAAAFWLERYDPRQPVRRSAQKIGRNDPCACGSGRKYKHCCGGAATVH